MTAAALLRPAECRGEESEGVRKVRKVTEAGEIF